MDTSPAFGAFALDRFYTLPTGTRIRLRLARVSDRRRIGELLERTGRTNRLDAGRLVRVDPRRCAVVCTTALIDGREAIVGIGMVELGSEEPPAPVIVAVDERVPGVRALLSGVLLARAHALTRARAA